MSVALVGFKLWLGTHVAASAMMADDDENLNRAIYFIRGNPYLTGYPFSKIAYGPLYPLVVSPSLLFGHPSVRLGAVFAINAALGAVVVFLGSQIVYRLTGVAALLVPVCLAAYAALFQMSFYAVTENLLLPMLVLVGWLVVDFDETSRNPRKLALLAALAVLLPLVRIPGFAVVPGLLLLVLRHRSTPVQRRLRILAAVTVLVAAALYFLVYRLVLTSDREETYLATLAALLLDSQSWSVPGRLALSQLAYLFVSTGYWVLPVCIVIALQTRRTVEGPLRRRWVDYLLWTAATGAGFLFFALIHLTVKASTSGDSDLIFGRYDDPAALLLVIAGLAGLLALKPLTRFERVVLRVLAPVALCLVLPGMLGARYVPVNQSGLSIFSTGQVDLRWALLGTVLATSVSQLADDARRHVPAALSVFLLFALVSDWQGMRYTIVRAQKVAFTVQGSDWIAANVPRNGRIGYDGSIIGDPAPAVYPRTMADVYRVMMFRTYPRSVVIVDSPAGLDQVDFLYSAITSKSQPVLTQSPRLAKVWTNGRYRLYQVVPEISVVPDGPRR